VVVEKEFLRRNWRGFPPVDGCGVEERIAWRDLWRRKDIFGGGMVFGSFSALFERVLMECSVRGWTV